MQQVPSSTRASIKIWPASPSVPGPLVGPPALPGASAIVFQWPCRASPQAPRKGKETCADRTAGEGAENRCVQEEPAQLKPPRAGVGDRMLARVSRPGRATEKLWPGPGVVNLKPARHPFCPCPPAAQPSGGLPATLEPRPGGLTVQEMMDLPVFLGESEDCFPAAPLTFLGSGAPSSHLGL